MVTYSTPISVLSVEHHAEWDKMAFNKEQAQIWKTCCSSNDGESNDNMIQTKLCDDAITIT